MADFLDECRAAIANVTEPAQTKQVASDPVKFVHIREQEAWIDIAGGSVTYHPAPNGGLTIAYYLLPEEGQQWLVRFALAQCSPRDNYNKKVGRAIARGRLCRSAVENFYIPDQLSGAEITNAVIAAALASLEQA